MESNQDKRPVHRACAYCRGHRIKCIPVEREDRCKQCLNHNIECDKQSAPPKDARPRRRQLYKAQLGRQHLQFQPLESIYLGSSSPAILSWKYAPQDADVIDRLRGVDDKHTLYRGVIGAQGQDGVLVAQHSSKLEKQPPLSINIAQASIMNELAAQSVLTSLYESCRDRIIPLFPVVSVSESLLTESATADHLNKYISIDTKSSPPTPLPRIVRMIHCALAARSRLVPSRVRDSVMTNLRNLLASPEMVGLSSTQSLGSVQVLTLLCLCDDLNHADGLMASEAAWRNAGLASRTAFSVALHRNISSTHIPYYHLNRRFRIWGACICMDRWQAVRSGRGFGIDLADCDAPLPRSYADGIRDGDKTGPDGEPCFPCFRFLREFTTLSILLGRAYRLVGTPLGLQSIEDLSLFMLQMDIDNWLTQLPSEWPYSQKITLRQAPALMSLFIVALEFTFQRSFLWPSTPLPAHITYRPTKDRWSSLRQRAENAVYWLNSPDGAFYLDTWSITSYLIFCCLIIHLKAFEESNDSHHRWLVEITNNVIQEWAQQAPSNAIRSQLAAHSALLKDALGTHAPGSSTANTLLGQTFRGVNDWMVTDDLSQILGDGQIQGLDSSWFEKD